MFWSAISKALTERAIRTIGSVRSFLGLAYTSRLTEDQVFEMLRGRTIALVGNAASLSDTACGAAIEAHDVIVRFNGAPLPSPRSHGTRTTILATSLDVMIKLVRERHAEHIFFMSPRPKYLPGWLVRRPDFFLYPIASHAALMQEIGARPTTGMMMIDLLRRSPCGRCDLYGFDFFDSASLSNVRPPRSSPHDFAAERKIVIELVRQDGRFHLNSASAGDN